MRHAAFAIALLTAVAPAARAAEAEGLEFEKPAVLSGVVVDVVCSLGGSCPPRCGDGRRVLGVLAPDGVLRTIAKGPVDFAGAVQDLLPFCGRVVEADGLLIENPEIRIFKLQAIRGASSEPWTPARRFETEWEKAHGKADEWMRVDPRVKQIIDESGVLGTKRAAAPK